MARLLLILALVATVFWVYTIVDCAVQSPSRHRGVSKPAWMAIVILLPVLGGILWFLIGRGRAGKPVVRRAPDDDPEFLGRMTPSARAEQDERIRRLEEELAQLDSEADDPAPPKKSADPGDDPRKPGDDDTRGQRGAVA
ncbi:PLD nuclease N-terminal domain-containing protein [Microbacterium testaceum]|uniref:PLD nuclease N-terminal domain-containing protein n=1 Tax=Microbacterium testaceum TaxID=2033 RepID=UPI0022E10E79|nr:PLD nuclease N-terminal domain-containing protein [Microbacterium testaceum]